ncbi:MAG TPA: hypothetical protein VNQ79_12410 [Blastocatellia bacterium]|nr:hypothetical protein [Blastocatellia bacterium]
MFELKKISREAIPQALERAERYRLLNDPGEAESICLDVLAVDPENQQALVTMLLAITDRYGKGYAVSETRAREILPRLKDEYQRAYYAGIICERRAKAILHSGVPGGAHEAYEWLREAMNWYEKAEVMRPPGNDAAVLRWNTCARMIMRNNLSPRPRDVSPEFGE